MTSQPEYPSTDIKQTAESKTYSDSEIKSTGLAIIIGVVFGGLGTGVAFPILPLLDGLLGISAIVLGIILSANRIARLLMNAPAGNIIDRIGARRPMIVGLFVQGLAPFGYVLGLYTPTGTFVVLPWIGAVSNSAAMFIFARSMWGIGSAFVFIGAIATITFVTTRQNRGKWLGYLRGGQSLGFPLGLIVGGILFDLYDAQTAFLVGGILSFSAGFVAFKVLPDVEPDTDAHASIRHIPNMLRQKPRILLVSAGNFTIQFIYAGVILATIVKYAAAKNVGFAMLSAAGISGILLGVGSLSSSASTVISGRISDHLDNRAVLTVPAFLSMAIGFVALVGFPSLLGMLLSLALIGIGVGGTSPTLLAILGDMTPGNELGRMGGVYNFVGDIGMSLGPLLAIPLVDIWIGFQLTYLGCILLILITLAIVTVPLLRYE